MTEAAFVTGVLIALVVMFGIMFVNITLKDGFREACILLGQVLGIMIGCAILVAGSFYIASLLFPLGAS